MYEEVFPQLKNGWKFLQLHIHYHSELFNKVLAKRRDNEQILGQERKKSEKMKAMLNEALSKKMEKVKKQFERQAKIESK